MIRCILGVGIKIYSQASSQSCVPYWASRGRSTGRSTEQKSSKAPGPHISEMETLRSPRSGFHFLLACLALPCRPVCLLLLRRSQNDATRGSTIGDVFFMSTINRSRTRSRSRSMSKSRKSNTSILSVYAYDDSTTRSLPYRRRSINRSRPVSGIDGTLN